MQRAAFANEIPKPDKGQAGRTAVSRTPLTVRTQGVHLDDATRRRVREQLGRKLGKYALHIERATVRFFDINGPRGGVDTACRINVVLSNLPSVVVEDAGTNPGEAFAGAATIAGRTVRRTLDKSGLRTPRRLSKEPEGEEPSLDEEQAPADGKAARSLTGRTGGRANGHLDARRSPEKKRRDDPVDTAQPDTSASDRKVGSGSSANRNTKLNQSGMTAALEGSATGKASRKSTRGSANRAKSGTNQERREALRTASPQARARRAAVRS